MAINQMNFNVLPIIFSNTPHLLNNIVKFNNNLLSRIKITILCLLIVLGIISISFFYIILITQAYLVVGIKIVSKINQNNISNIITGINNFKNVVKSRFKLEEIDEKSIEKNTLLKEKSRTKIENKEGIIDKEESTNSNNLEQNYFIETKKFQKLKYQSFIIMFFFINIIVIFIILTFIYFTLKIIINDNANLIKSESYILQKFFYTSIILYRLKCKILNFSSFSSINFSNIINESLSENLFQTLKKSKMFNDLYYNGFKLNACYALFDKSSDNYSKCITNPMIIEFNSTDAVKQFILRNIDLLDYEIDTKNEIENFNSLEIMSGDDYTRILLIFKEFYINVYERFENIIENVLVNEIKVSKVKCLIISFSLIISGILNLLYIIFYLKKYYEKMLLVSKSFIQIIPTNVIFNTPDLEAWVEKTDKN